MTIFVFKEALGQFAAFGIGIQEFPEPLELVQDDEIWFHGVQAGISQEAPEPRHEPTTVSQCFPGPVPRERVAQVEKFLLQLGPDIADRTSEALHDASVDLTFRDPPFVISESINGLKAAQKHIAPDTNRSAPSMSQHSVQDDAFLNDTLSRRRVE